MFSYRMKQKSNRRTRLASMIFGTEVGMKTKNSRNH